MGNFVYHGGRPLSALPLDTPARIVHIEDEPETVYAQLVAEGLYPGMDVRLLEVSPTRARLGQRRRAPAGPIDGGQRVGGAGRDGRF